MDIDSGNEVITFRPAGEEDSSSWLRTMTREPDNKSETSSSPEEEEVVESEPDPPAEDAAPEDEGHLDKDGPREGDPEPQPQDATEGHPKVYAGKYKSPEDLEQAYTHQQQLVGRHAQRIQQLEYQLQQTQVQAAQQLPTRFDQLSEEHQRHFVEMAERFGSDPVSEYRLYLERQDQQTSQQQQAFAHNYQLATQHVLSHIEDPRFTPHKNAVMRELEQHPEAFEVMRGLAPEQMASWGRYYLDLLADRAEFQQLKAKHTAEVEAARKAGIEEARKAKLMKQGSRTAAGTAGTVRPASGGASVSETGSMLDQLMRRKEARETSY